MMLDYYGIGTLLPSQLLFQLIYYVVVALNFLFLIMLVFLFVQAGPFSGNRQAASVQLGEDSRSSQMIEMTLTTSHPPSRAELPNP